MAKKTKAKKKARKSKAKSKHNTRQASSVYSTLADELPILDLLKEDQMPEKVAFFDELPIEDKYRTDQTDDLLANTQVQISFTVSADFRRIYKLYAIDQDMSMLEVFKASFELYKRVYPSEETPI